MRTVWWIPGLALLALGAAVLDAESGVARWWHLRGELQEAAVRIAGLEAEVAGLREETQRLENEPFAIERAIREELELARPGQQIVRLRGEGFASGWNP